MKQKSFYQLSFLTQVFFKKANPLQVCIICILTKLHLVKPLLLLHLRLLLEAIPLLHHVRVRLRIAHRPLLRMRRQRQRCVHLPDNPTREQFNGNADGTERLKRRWSDGVEVFGGLFLLLCGGLEPIQPIKHLADTLDHERHREIRPSATNIPVR